jgi:copper chaperone CopZ
MGALVPQNGWQPYLGGGILSIVAMMLLGIPLYVCASASVPIAAGLIHLGASPGAALAFLISGPATNAATITTVWRLLGGRATLLYLLTIVISAVGGGLTLDWFMPIIPGGLPALGAHAHEAMGQQVMGVGALSAISAAALLLVVVCAYAIGRSAEPHADALGPQDDASQDAAPRDAASQTTAPQAVGGDVPSAKYALPLEHRELTVKGMTCGHCVAAVTRALSECPGVASAQVDLSTGRAVVSGRGLKTSQLLDAVAQLGYTAEIT